MKVEILRFLFVTWPRYWSVTWLCWWGLLILNHHSARFGAHRSYGTGKKWRLLCQLQFQFQLQCQCRGLQMAHIRLLISFIEKKRWILYVIILNGRFSFKLNLIPGKNSTRFIPEWNSRVNRIFFIPGWDFISLACKCTINLRKRLHLIKTKTIEFNQ